MDGKKKVILIVDDDDVTVDLLKLVLDSEPHVVTIAAANSEEALDILRRIRVHLVILDYLLPGVDGLHLFDMLREEPVTANVPVLFLTAAAQFSGFKERHLTNYISKPYDLDELLERINCMLQCQ